jgi:hypothetical protein
VEVRGGPQGVTREARRRIREAARRSNGAVKYEGNCLVVQNNSLGLSVLGSLMKDLGGVERLMAYWLDTIPFNKLENRLRREEERNRALGIKQLGKSYKGRLRESGDLGPLR